MARTTGEAVNLNACGPAGQRCRRVGLSFIAVRIDDQRGDLVPASNDLLTFSISRPGEIVATDIGYPTLCGVLIISKDSFQ